MKKSKKGISIGIIGVCSIALFIIGSKLGNNINQIPKVEIGGDTFAILLDNNQISTLPTSGAYLIDYTCDNNSTLEWNRETGKLYLSKNTNVQENCSVRFKTNPLVSELKQGDYVAYEGNNGCQLNGTATTGTSDAESSNSCLGYNANDTIDTNDNTYGYCFSDDNKFYVKGWRVAYIEDNRAYLISAGSPECNRRTEATGNTTYISEANEKAKKYCNSSYVDGNCSDNSDSWAIGDTDFNKITAQMTNTAGGYLYTTISGATKCGGANSKEVCGYNNDLIDNGGFYWFASAYSASETSGVSWFPFDRSVYNGSFSNADAYGLRPIIRLSSSVYVTGGSGTMDAPYTIANNTFSINNGAKYATNSVVTLNLVGSDSISQMCISNAKDCTTYEPFTNSKNWALTSGDGEKKVYVYYKNSSGKIITSIEKSIILDTTPPTNNSVQISSKDNIQRTLTLSSTGADYMCFSNTSSDVNDCKNWVDFGTTYSWTLSPNNGEKTVYAFFKDKAGHTASTQTSVTCNNCVLYIVNEDFADDTYDSNLTIAGSGDYPWIVSEGQFISNNKKQAVSTSTSTITFTPTQDSKLSFDCGMTSWGNTLTITLTGTDSSNKSLVELTYLPTGSVTDEPLSAGVTYTLKLESYIDNEWTDSHAYIDNLKIEPQ